ncbi:MAG: ribonucleoside triphosphate reductase [Cellulosilyticaceae bacterium]
MLKSKDLVENYTKKKDWRVKENSNAPYSYGALGKYINAEVEKDYWLREVYPKDIVDAYIEGYLHLHDLGGLTAYCCGYSLRAIIGMGVMGIPNIPRSKPAKHFSAILNQLSNLTTVFQNEIMGAVAFSSVDTLLAPYIKEDHLSYEEVKQNVQNFIFSINSNSRGGAEPAFSNCTLDLTPPDDLVDTFAVIGGNMLSYTYKNCQTEMDMFNKAFFEVMLEGDADGVPFAYPIPTYNIHKRFDWDNPNNDLLWEMAGKYGTPYFANFGPNSDMDPSDARSMCCRLRLDKRELLRRNGGLFGSGESTGSIGVVTLNLPRFAYMANHDTENFLSILSYYMDIAKDSLEIKRKYIQTDVLEAGLIPAFNTYIGTLNNHFSTIGYIGMNEVGMNLFGKDITDPMVKAFCIKTLKFMREKLQEYQEETDNLYNLEATPAESTCYRLAKLDKETYPDIFTQGTDKTPYYTNSCHIPVNMVKDIISTTEHQDELQALHTGGTVIHYYLDGPISGAKVKHIVKTIVTNYKAPFFSISPLNCICPEHGLLSANYDNCPICGKEVDKYQRITGYRRNVKFFNPGKAAEFTDREQMKLGEGNDCL